MVQSLFWDARASLEMGVSRDDSLGQAVGESRADAAGSSVGNGLQRGWGGWRGGWREGSGPPTPFIAATAPFVCSAVTPLPIPRDPNGQHHILTHAVCRMSPAAPASPCA